MFRAEVAKKLINLLKPHALEFLIPKFDCIFIRINKESLKESIKLSVGEGFTHLSAITVLNFGDYLEVLYHLSGNGLLINLRIILSQNDYTLPTITDIIPGAALHEREVHDLFGIKFEGNPDLRPLILPEDWPEDTYPMRRRG